MIVRRHPMLHGRPYLWRTIGPRRVGMGQVYQGYVGEDCSPLDAACVQRNMQRSTFAIASHVAAQQASHRETCEENNALNYPLHQRDCDALFPGVNPDVAVQSYVETGDWGALPGVWVNPASGEASNAPPHYGGPPPAATAPPAPPPPATRALSARLVNETRAAGHQVGDNWRVEVTGPPNQPVTVSAIHNGRDLGTSPLGTTDAGGRHVSRGQFTADVIGSWSETWRVGGNVAGSVNFTVTEKAAPAGERRPPPATDGAEPPPPPAGFDFQTIGARIPTWGWVALAAGGAFLLAGTSRGR